MDAFTVHTGVVMPMDRVNVDTDQIIPKQFLKRVERDGYEDFLFFDWRFNADGSPNPDFVLNFPVYKDATVMVAGRNFGCGSSREHAPWALQQYGFRAIIAPSYADIFYNNCLQNGLLPVRLSEADVDRIMIRSKEVPGYQVKVDLESCTVTDNQGLSASFDLDEFKRYCLLNGLDDIGITLQDEDAIAAFESQRG
ncbi:MAG: 3-isopropylmalate dehydratase small subunit [Chloroflexota bacterium]|nr:3-isopropylmalate dehydratase small subunit [Chloroflexota bacterium]MDE2901019.1 3-isopropylmalate dehydratase small subunit [Chloroflexota bacterium]MDE2969379.1 3-isopropylmalate dehydratase small subunit [Chloroflexota bacterium]